MSESYSVMKESVYLVFERLLYIVVELIIMNKWMYDGIGNIISFCIVVVVLNIVSIDFMFVCGVY